MNLAIFCCHPEEDGLINTQVIDVVRQLKTVSERIIIVSNGRLSADSKNALKGISQEIIERKNEGLDYGGYRHILKTYLDYEALEGYDSLILCNDSFFGFFTPIEQIFREMSLMEYDLWGLNKVERGLLDHIQSYLMVVRKNVYKDLYQYFTDNKVEDNDYGKTAALMEPKLYRYFKQRGYKLGSWTDTKLVDIYANPDECIKKYNLPIIKRKCFKEKTDLLGQQRIKLSKAAITEEKLLSFGNEGPFYIFGGGTIAKEIYHTYFTGNSNFINYIVSESEGTSLLSLKDLTDYSRVIIAVKDTSQSEVEKVLPMNCNYIKLWNV